MLSIRLLYYLLARVKIKDLKSNMYLLDEITLENGVLLIPKGVIINDIILNKIYTFSSLIQLNRDVEVKHLGER